MSEIVKVDMSQYGLEETKAAEIRKDFDAVLKIATELEGEFNDVVKMELTPETCKTAKALGNKFVKVRTGIEKVRVERKRFYLAGGKAVDGLGHAYKFAVEGYETKLKEISTHFEIIEKNRVDSRFADRTKSASECGVEFLGDEFRAMSADAWGVYISGLGVQHKDRVAAEKKAEDDRIAAEKADAAERKRTSEENKRLKVEAEERDKKEASERAEREKVENARIAKDTAERRRVASEREAERKEADAKLAKERAEREKVELEAETKRRDEEQAKADSKARERNQANRKRVNNAALDSIVSIGFDISNDQAKEIVKAIASGKIENVVINY